MDLAETDENGNENERGNENEKGSGRQEGYKCGIGRRPCKATLCRDLSQAQGRPAELYNILGQHTLKGFQCQSRVQQDLPGLCI